MPQKIVPVIIAEKEKLDPTMIELKMVEQVEEILKMAKVIQNKDCIEHHRVIEADQMVTHYPGSIKPSQTKLLDWIVDCVRGEFGFREDSFSLYFVES